MVLKNRGNIVLDYLKLIARKNFTEKKKVTKKFKKERREH